VRWILKLEANPFRIESFSITGALCLVSFSSVLYFLFVKYGMGLVGVLLGYVNDLDILGVLVIRLRLSI